MGIGLGLGYAAASLIGVRMAERTRNFVVTVFGGMIVRMTVALMVVVLVMWLGSVVAPVFIGAFLCVFITGIAVEIAWLHNRSVPC